MQDSCAGAQDAPGYRRDVPAPASAPAPAPAPAPIPVVLDGPTWRARAAAHRSRVERWTLPHRERRRRREAHPVLDFLFTYYSHRPAQLEQWHPGPGVALRDAEEFLDVPGHVRRPDGTVALDPAALPARHRTTAAFVRALLAATASRAPRLSCFGLHEWAMVYRTDAPAARRGAAAAGRRRHRCRRRVAPRALHAPRRVPVLHRRRAPPQRRLPHPRRPGRARAARLPARDDGPLQVGLQARPRHPRRAAGRLLRPRRGRPHPRHAGEPL